MVVVKIGVPAFKKSSVKILETVIQLIHQVPRLPIILNYLLFTVFLIIFLTINPNPPCRLSLWEETGEPGEDARLSAEC